MTTYHPETKARRQSTSFPERCSCAGKTDTTAIDVRALLAETRRRLLRHRAEQLTLFEDDFSR
jgi:hypothetical protein